MLWSGVKQALEEGRHRRLPNGAQGERGEGDAKLRGRKVGVQSAQQALGDLGGGNAPLHQFGDARLTHPHERELRRDEKSIEGDQEEGQPQF